MSMIIGLTGPTGAGKSEVASRLCKAGLKIIDADVFSRRLISHNKDILPELTAAFSNDIISSDGTLNRAKLAEYAFASRESTDRLNDIMLPKIADMMIEQADSLISSGERACVFDAPLLFESGLDKKCDAVIAVIADKSVRLDRIMIRDNIDKSKAESRIKAQFDDSYYTQRADFIIRNDGSSDELDSAVADIIDWIKSNEAYN